MSAARICGKNLMGVGIYIGPCTPPNTDWHHYTLTLVATDLDPPPRHPGGGRDLFPSWAPAFAGVAGFV